MALRTALLTLTFGLAMAGLIPLIRQPEWWIRAFDFPLSQFAVASFLTLTAWLVFGRPLGRGAALVLVALALSLSVQLFKLMPYTRLAPLAVPPATADAPRLTVMVVNTLMENRRHAELCRTVEAADPDIVVFTETDKAWSRGLHPLEQRYPHALEEPLDNTYGLIVRSKLPLQGGEIRNLISDEIPSMRATIEVGGRRLRFYALHPKPPYPAESLETTGRDGELLLVAREIAERGEPAILAGDFNAISWSRSLELVRNTGGLLDPRIGRGLFNTFVPNSLGVATWPLDHVFVTRHFSLAHLATRAVAGSDHRALIASLAFEPQSVAEVPEADPEQREAAEETIEEAVDTAGDGEG